MGVGECKQWNTEAEVFSASKKAKSGCFQMCPPRK